MVRFLVVVFLALIGCSKGRSFPPALADREYSPGHPIVLNAPSSTTADDLVARTNVYRASNGLGPLLRSAALDALALAHSSHMRSHRFYSHDNPEGDGPYERLARTEAGAWPIAENIWIVLTTDSVQFILDGFIASPDHNANLLSDTDLIGVGISEDPLGAVYVTMDFVRS